MSKHAIMIVLDLDVKIDSQATHAILDKIPVEKLAQEAIEGITKLRIETLIEKRAKGLEIKMIRAKYLGIAE